MRYYKLSILVIFLFINCMWVSKQDSKNDTIEIKPDDKDVFYQFGEIKLKDTISTSFRNSEIYKKSKLQSFISNMTTEQIDDNNVIRFEGILKFKLNNGKIKKFESNPGHPELEFNDTSFIQYIYLKKINETFWLIFENYGHPCAGGFVLINRNNGDLTRIEGEPIVSPDGNLMITGLVDECLGHYIDLYEVVNSKVKLIRKLYINPQNWWIKQVGWIDNNNVIFNGGLNQKTDQNLIITIR